MDRIRRESQRKADLLRDHQYLSSFVFTPSRSDVKPSFLLSPHVPAQVNATSILAFHVALGSLPLHVIFSDVFMWEGAVHRKAWAVYRTEEERNNAREALNHPSDGTPKDEAMVALTWQVVEKDGSLPQVRDPPSICPPIAASRDRMEVDLRQALGLIEKVGGKDCFGV